METALNGEIEYLVMLIKKGAFRKYKTDFDRAIKGVLNQWGAYALCWMICEVTRELETNEQKELFSSYLKAQGLRAGLQ
jgi:hypothetical protein